MILRPTKLLICTSTLWCGNCYSAMKPAVSVRICSICLWYCPSSFSLSSVYQNGFGASSVNCHTNASGDL
ncbi:Uncharacterised protein [Vibrio cholerae]|nr:Uncharacterised protein [Vibrio cholerae]